MTRGVISQFGPFVKAKSVQVHPLEQGSPGFLEAQRWVAGEAVKNIFDAASLSMSPGLT